MDDEFRSAKLRLRSEARKTSTFDLRTTEVAPLASG